ncbi:transcriptional regulator [Pelotomaculum thermopropionicum SI]|uniref:HTH-type transcriptional regulatory protein TyrR n=1 Tax=Pelotomaculum thermopropionicum (strain DSM 13744 / JCM 10971 / SI) TaxID=370438 RepID=A5D2Z2_PELTS|nr:transcriptional regulator [Pelotomaculum thermopropionicum SI]
MQREKFFDLVPVGIIFYDGKGSVIAANELASKIIEENNIDINDGISNKPGAWKIMAGNKTYVAGRVEIGDALVKKAVFLIDITGWEFYWNELNELKEQVKELEDTFNSSFDEIYVIDGKGITKRINKAGETNYGVPVENLLGKNVADLEREGYYNPSVSRMVFREKKRITITQKTKSGKHLIATGNPIFDENGEIIRVVVNSRDISELLNLRKQLEDTEQLVESYRQQLLKLSQERIRSDELIARSPQMKKVIEMVDKVAQVDSTVLIMGESGVGKGVIASRLHRLSRRAKGPFITINCGAIPEHLLESELFGYEGGAFTGARKEGKKGLLELANGGTVFLDEITELPLSLQVKLLQVIQDKKLIRVGGSKYISVDIRFVAATNKDIQRMVAEGLFREDLYYRLNVIPVIIPPLRYRQEDIPVLLEYFLEKLNTKYEKNKKFTPEAIEILRNYNWPGNVRELENLVERLLVTKEGNEITVSHLPEYIFEGKSRFPNRIYVLDICPLKEAVEEMEKQLFSMAYNRLKNTYKVADALAINQSTVVRKIQKYNLLSRAERRTEKK